MQDDTSPAWLDREAYPFRPHRLELPEGQGRIHYVDEGPGEPILFVHGTPTWSFEWRHLILALSRTHRCIAPDHLGFGLSDRPPEADYTPEAHAARLAAFVDALGLERFTLVVHDFGGPIGLPLALDGRGRVRRLLVIDSWMWAFDDPLTLKRGAMISGRIGRFLYRRLDASLRVLMPSVYGDRRKLTREIHAQYLAPFRDPDARERVLFSLARALLGSRSHYDALWQRRAELARIEAAAVVWGAADHALPAAHLERWRQALPSAHVSLLEGVGHWPHEEEPARVLEVLTRLLATAPEVAASAP